MAKAGFTKPIIISLLLTFFTCYSFGQDSLRYRHKYLGAVKINPLSILTGISGSVELQFSKRNSLSLGGAYWNGNIIPITQTFTRVNGLSIAYRRYSKDQTFKSGFIEPFVRYNKIWEVNQPGWVNAYTLGAVIGQRWLFSQAFCFELFAGPYYCKPFAVGFDPNKNPTTANSKLVNETDKTPFNGFWIRAGLYLGVFF